jgi:DNA primase
MAFPPEFLDEIRQRVPLADVVGRRVQFDKRKSNYARRDFWACCPFHSEKTPSFHVDEGKGRYHCFGCGAGGDALTFLRETEGLSFPEAVEVLAGIAGVPVPQPSPQARVQAERRAGLTGAMAAAAAFFRESLQGPAGREARAYLERRGLDADTIRRFGLGWAPGGKELRTRLEKLGLSPEQMIEAGLVRRSDRDGSLYDYFRNRVIFPITDVRERIIAFGGRGISPEVAPKYLNSPDTPLFNKSRVLYNLPAARRAARDAGTVIVAEGYMDVIALVRAGFGHTVAPLGTALTEDHLTMLWSMAGTPVLCFDGDEAGLRAAWRSVDRALPLLTPGRSLRFAVLEGGQDPDDLIAAEGPSAMQAALDGALSLAAMIWRRETEHRRFETPEARAALEARLDEISAGLPDRRLRYHFREDFRARLRTMFSASQGRAGAGRHKGPAQAPGVSSLLRRSALAQMSRRSVSPSLAAGIARREAVERDLQRHAVLCRGREQALIRMAVAQPWMVARHWEELAEVTFLDRQLEELRRGILDLIGEKGSLDSGQLRSHLSRWGNARELERMLDQPDIHGAESAHPAHEGNPRLEHEWLHILSRHRRELNVRSELNGLVEAARSEFSDRAIAQLTALLTELWREESTRPEPGG